MRYHNTIRGAQMRNHPDYEHIASRHENPGVCSIAPLILAGIATAVGSVGGAAIGGSAAKNAAQETSAASRENTALQREQFDYARNSMAPYVAGGQLGFGQLLNELGLT